MKFSKPKSIEKLFPETNEEAIDLLKKMLVFNPTKRISFKEALKHKYFDTLYNHPDFVPSQKSKKETFFDSSFEDDLEDIKSKNNLITFRISI